MMKLIQNEWIKILKRAGTYVMLGLLLLMVTVVGAFIKYQQTGGEIPDNQEWKQALLAENKALQSQLERLDGPHDHIVSLERTIAINNYRIEHDISPNEKYSMWTFISDTSQLIEFAGLFTIIIAAGMLASEFGWGTIKLLLIRPISRKKLLASKYITVLLFGLFAVTFLFVYSAALGAVLFGIPDSPAPYLNYFEGKISEQSIGVHLVIYYGLKSISLLMLATMAFMVSAVFRNSSLAIGLSLFLLFTGGQITSLIAMKYDWAKYLLFANTDLLQYFEGVPIVEGMTITFSVIMLIAYFLLFQFLAFYVFQKRDVTA